MLKKGPGSMNHNMQTLMQPVLSPARQKALQTISKTRNITLAQAQQVQAESISRAQLRKK
jgi:hypothetical protein